MASFDLDALLAEISPESPCGDNLEYDAAFQEMERASQGRAEQQFGDTIVPAEEPDWKEVRKKAVDVLSRSRDLRAAVHLTSSLLHLEGLTGFRDGLSLVRGLLLQFWPSVHPQLDPDDDNDPTFRVNTLSTLCDYSSTLESIKKAPLVQSRTLGRFGYRDIEIATGDYPRPEEGAVAEMPTIEAAFLDGELEEIQATADAVREAKEMAVEIDRYLTETLGTSQAPDMSGLPKTLSLLSTVLDAQLARRGVGEVDEEVGDGAGGEGGGAKPGKQLTGEVRTPEDVIRAIDKIIDYYNRNEPSSPVPLLLMRAKRLVSKSFMEILADLAPGGMPEAETIRGVDTTVSDGY